MHAIVTAGGIPQPGEPLYEYTQGSPKALLDIYGKPMVQWVLDALDQAQVIEQIILVGLPADSGIKSPKIACFIPNQGGLLQNLRAGMNKVLEISPSTNHLLTVSSDIPGITADMVTWVVEAAMKTDEDAYYNVITRQAMEIRYPESRRSYARFKDVEVCGGDMNIIRARIGTENDALWARIIDARKSVLKQASLIGYSTLFLMLFRAITLEQAVHKVSERLNIAGRAILCPFPEIGMDVDKPFQLEIMRADLAQQTLA
jgi:GTP:adenosylcobinamide-phosphate guanylyltransferase